MEETRKSYTADIVVKPMPDDSWGIWVNGVLDFRTRVSLKRAQEYADWVKGHISRVGIRVQEP